MKIIVTKDETQLSGEQVLSINDIEDVDGFLEELVEVNENSIGSPTLDDFSKHLKEVLNKANTDRIQQEIIYLKAENEKIHQLLKEILPTDEIKKRTFNILTEVLCKNCERVFSLYEELRVKDIKQESK